MLIRRIAGGFAVGAVLLSLFSCAGVKERGERAPLGTLSLASSDSAGDGRYAGRLYVPTEKEIRACLSLAPGEKNLILDWSWQAPDGTVFGREKRKIFGDTDCVSLPLAGAEAATKTGHWEVQVQTSGRSAVAKEFELTDSKKRWLARNADFPGERHAALQKLCSEGDDAFLARHFSLDLSLHERIIVWNCLGDSAGEGIGTLARLLGETPEDENLLVLAYQIKQGVVGRLLAGDGDRQRNLAALESLVNRWDVEVLARLLEGDDPALRLEGIRLLVRTGSPEAPFALKGMLAAESPRERTAAVRALGELGGQFSRDLLRERLEQEGEQEVRAAILQALGAE